MNLRDFLSVELEDLSRFARVLTGDRELAHDVLFDVLEKAQRSWSRIEALDQPAAYLRKMVLNRFLDERRRWSSRMIRATNSGTLPDVPVDGGQERVDDRTELGILLSTLPRLQRATIVLRFYLDLPDAEIADALGCSQGAVRAHISRGLKQLRTNNSAEPAGFNERGDRA